MTHAWLKDIPEGAARVTALSNVVPTLKTERTVLRLPRLSDWETLEPIWRTDRGIYIGGPMNGEDSFLDFNQTISSWFLRGFGFWTVTLAEDDNVIGLVGLGMEYGDQDLELGWLLIEAAEGQGLAFEAASAARDYARSQNLPTLVSYIDSRNARSQTLAQKLGATRDPAAEAALGPDVDAHVWRHWGDTSKGASQ